MQVAILQSAASPPCLVDARRNSEIYNHQAIRETQLSGIDNPSKSDSSIVGYL